MTAPFRPSCDCSTAGPLDLAPLEEIIRRTGRNREHIIPILQAIQRQYRYLPQAALERVCELTAIRPAELLGVATFYKQFRHEPVGRHLIRVCQGTACHVKGAPLLSEAIARELKLAPGRQTDARGEFTLDQVACLGCCSLAPAVQVDEAIYGNLTISQIPALLEEVRRQGQAGTAAASDPERPAGEPDGEARIALDSCCLARGARQVCEALGQAVARHALPVRVKSVGCLGLSCRAPLVEIVRPGLPAVLYADVTVEGAEEILLRHFRPQGAWRRLRASLTGALDLLLDEGRAAPPAQALPPPSAPAARFLGGQVRVATEHSGELDPLDLAEYRARGGLAALEKALREWTPEELIGIVTRSGLRGRGGAGYPTGRKWGQVRAAPGETKYVICNGDEGDPGAFMDRMLLESYPFRVLEGLALAALAVGAEEGIFYIREEYPLAVRRVEEAILACERAGVLGQACLGSARALRFQVVRGAGAFVCGEETALIASLEGRRGTPRLRPPYPSERGLWDRPTLINNVETLAVVPWILRNGAEAFARIGTSACAGTKVFALAGKVERSGLVEVPMGITIRQVVEDLGGGVPGGKRLKAVQIGGPSGGCVPAHLAGTPIDYEALQGAGAIMGSGGMVVLDEDDCMVDMARYFLGFAQEECCGHCSVGRIGTRRMLDILDRLCAGHGRQADLAELEQLSGLLRQASLCGLCRTAPNPVSSTLAHFREEYEAHLAGRCPAGRCKALIRYEIDPDCIGCTLCAQHCPAACIEARPYEVHRIEDANCTRCDACRQVCPVSVVKVR